MMVTKAVPELLEGYSTHTTEAVARVEGTLAAYRLALARLATAQTDLAVPSADRGTMVAATLRTVTAFDRTPAVYATQLRAIDWAVAMGYAALRSPPVQRALTVHGRLNPPLSVLEAWAGTIAIRDLVSSQWALQKLKVRRWLALRWAHLRAWPSRFVLGLPSVKGQAGIEGAAGRYRPAIDTAEERVLAGQKRVAKPLVGRLGPVAKVLGPVGHVANTQTFLEGSPYHGTRGVIDRGVAGASLAASGVLVVAGIAASTSVLATGAVVVAGAVLVGATAWAIGNLVANAWADRRAIATSVSAAGRAAANGARAGVQAVGRGIEAIGARVQDLGEATAETGVTIGGATR